MTSLGLALVYFSVSSSLSHSLILELLERLDARWFSTYSSSTLLFFCLENLKFFRPWCVLLGAKWGLYGLAWEYQAQVAGEVVGDLAGGVRHVYRNRLAKHLPEFLRRLRIPFICVQIRWVKGE